MNTEGNNIFDASSGASAQSIPATSPVSSSAATNFRWRIMSTVMLIMAVTALNRLNLSIAGKTFEGRGKTPTPISRS